MAGSGITGGIGGNVFVVGAVCRTCERSAVWKGDDVGTCDRYIIRHGCTSGAGVPPFSLGVDTEADGEGGECACELEVLVLESFGVPDSPRERRFLDSALAGSTRV